MEILKNVLFIFTLVIVYINITVTLTLGKLDPPFYKFIDPRNWFFYYFSLFYQATWWSSYFNLI